MKSDKLEVVRGSGNVFRDLAHKSADAEQFKAILAAEIIKALDRDGLSVRAAHGRTGIAAADFSRIRNADLGRFTVDRLMSIINRLGSRVEVKVRVRPSEVAVPEARVYETDASGLRLTLKLGGPSKDARFPRCRFCSPSVSGRQGAT
jgi:predicted XRE-type DNA-binding protein